MCQTIIVWMCVVCVICVVRVRSQSLCISLIWHISILWAGGKAIISCDSVIGSEISLFCTSPQVLHDQNSQREWEIEKIKIKIGINKTKWNEQIIFLNYVFCFLEKKVQAILDTTFRHKLCLHQARLKLKNKRNVHEKLYFLFIFFNLKTKAV